jgi:serine/threonine-protein kinase RsbW
MSKQGLRPSCEFREEDLLLRLDMTLPGTVEGIKPVVDSVMEIVREMGCAEGSEVEVELALVEALANAVRHGCRSDPGKTIECVVACDKDRGMLIIIRDPGEGFDPSQIPDPTVGENIYSTSGRGIYLINQLMDEVCFEKGGTEIRMRKK